MVPALQSSPHEGELVGLGLAGVEPLFKPRKSVVVEQARRKTSQIRDFQPVKTPPYTGGDLEVFRPRRPIGSEPPKSTLKEELYLGKPASYNPVSVVIPILTMTTSIYISRHGLSSQCGRGSLELTARSSAT